LALDIHRQPPKRDRHEEVRQTFKQDIGREDTSARCQDRRGKPIDCKVAVVARARSSPICAAIKPARARCGSSVLR
jgi:hypothetical protein